MTLTSRHRYTSQWIPVPKRPWGIYDVMQKDYMRDSKGQALTFKTANAVFREIERLEKVEVTR